MLNIEESYCKYYHKKNVKLFLYHNKNNPRKTENIENVCCMYVVKQIFLIFWNIVPFKCVLVRIIFCKQVIFSLKVVIYDPKMQRKFIIFSHDETKVYSSYKSISNPFMFMTWKTLESLQRIYFLPVEKIIKAKHK